ncbi:hypothetical protein [Oceanospirillum sediminis]|uniref:Uncharacterized protein n=1 Tax=Oceanospirillum sediminis TaxID=2760088 RepID=A0A839IPJ7_9GAMM|nr:hypothetical protein [Oceanospirillum sediminis]MBB1486851.1 hypothetical protein [Oceanospirillum sediminis]
MGTFNKLVIASVTVMAVSTQVAVANPFSALEPASNSQHGYLYDEESDTQENSESSEQNEISEPARTAEQNTTAESETSTKPHKQPEPVVVSEQKQVATPEVIITEEPVSVSESVNTSEREVNEQKNTVKSASVTEQKSPAERTVQPVIEPEQDNTRSEVAVTRTKKDPFAALEPSGNSQHGYLYSEEEMEAESVTSAVSQQQSKASAATDKKQQDDGVLSSLQKLDLDSAVKKLTNNLDEITFSEGVDEEVFKGLEPGPGSR